MLLRAAKILALVIELSDGAYFQLNASRLAYIAYVRSYDPYTLNPHIANHYSIIHRSGRPILQLLGQRLHTRVIGKKIYCYRKVKSTQKLALSLVERKGTGLDGTVIIAERQTNAIGRAGRAWMSPSGGIWLSVILNPNLLSSQSMLIMFLATLTVCEVLKSKTGLEPKIKWPNDVTINGRKVCGILVDVGAVIIKDHNGIFEATIEDIDLSGALVIRTVDGSTRTIMTQDVVL